MRDVSLHLAAPLVPCGDDEQHCPLLRICAVCGYRFVTTRGRRQHQNQCRGEVNAAVAAAQHDHLIHVHRIRKRRSTR